MGVGAGKWHSVASMLGKTEAAYKTLKEVQTPSSVNVQKTYNLHGHGSGGGGYVCRGGTMERGYNGSIFVIQIIIEVRFPSMSGLVSLEK